MKCQILFSGSGKNKKNISKCRLLEILPRVLSVTPFSVCQLFYHNSLYSFACSAVSDLSLHSALFANYLFGGFPTKMG